MIYIRVGMDGVSHGLLLRPAGYPDIPAALFPNLLRLYPPACMICNIRAAQINGSLRRGNGSLL